MQARWLPVARLLAVLPASASPQTEEVFAARRAAMVAEQLAAILVTAAPERIPESLAQQLAEGGGIVVPVGPEGGCRNCSRG